MSARHAAGKSVLDLNFEQRYDGNDKRPGIEPLREAAMSQKATPHISIGIWVFFLPCGVWINLV